MAIKLLKLLLFKMTILNLKECMIKYNLTDAIMKESDLQRIYKYHIYPRDSKIYSDKVFVIIDDGSQGGSHWLCFIIKDNISYYFDSVDGQPDKFLLNQLPKPIVNHNYKIQDINSKLCGSYCLYFFM